MKKTKENGWNADRHLCKKCQYRATAYNKRKSGIKCEYALKSGTKRSRGCEVEYCDKYVKGNPLKLREDMETGNGQSGTNNRGDEGIYL